MQLNVQFTIDVVKGGRIISMFPDFIKPWVSALISASWWNRVVNAIY